MTEPENAGIIQAGLDEDFPGELFPTLIVEDRASVDIQVLDPQPAYEEAREVCRQWVKSIAPSLPRRAQWTLAYLDGRASIVAQTSNGKHYEGKVHWATQSISWREVS